MIRMSSALLAFCICLPAYAANPAPVFDVPCTTLWPVVSDTIRNSGKYEPSSIDDAAMSATYKVGTAWSHMNDVVVLKASGTGCQLVIDAPFRGLAYNDARDLTERVKQGLAKAPAAQPQPAAAAGSTAAVAPAPQGAPVQNAQAGAGQGSLAQSAQTSLGTGGGSLAQSMASGTASRPAKKDTRSAAAKPATAGAGEQPAGPARLPSDARVTLSVSANCAKDPDPTGFFGSNFYSKCQANELNMVRDAIAARLGAAQVLAPGAGGSANYQLSVTLTKSIEKMNPVSDWLPASLQYEATYQLSDGAGSPIHSGTVASQGPDSHPVEAEKQFAAKIADVAAGFMSSGSQSGSAGAGQPASSQNLEIQRVFENASYEILGEAYRSLNPKPLLPDEARQAKRKAEQAQENYDAKAAKEAYIAGLKAANWWPEGMRGLALVQGSTGSPADAIVWMRRYLAFVPDAPDAAQMQAKIDEWSRLAPTPPEDPEPPMPPGMHVGFATMDTPAIVAMWKGQPDLEGALVTYVYRDSMAAKSGLVQGDIVLSFNGAQIHGAQEFLSASSKVAAGNTAELVVLRGTDKTSVKLQY